MPADGAVLQVAADTFAAKSAGGYGGTCSLPQHVMPPAHLTAQATAAGFGAVAGGLAFVALAVPPTMRPEYAWFAALEWQLLVFCTLFGLYMARCYRQGLAARGLPTRPARHPLLGTTANMGVACALLLLMPAWGPWLGVGLVRKVFVTVAAGLATFVVLGQVFSQLALLWWEWGVVHASPGIAHHGPEKGM